MAAAGSSIGRITLASVFLITLVVSLRALGSCGLRFPWQTHGIDFCPQDASPDPPTGEFGPDVTAIVVGQRQRTAALLGRLQLQPVCGIDDVDPMDRVVEEGGVAGALNVTLVWAGRADLDLFVSCPSDEIIFHKNKEACGGRLQVDMNAENGDSFSSEPVEDVLFEEGDVPSGTFEIGVTLYAGGNGATIPFEVVVRSGEDGGTILERFEAEIAEEKELMVVGTFTVRP